MRLMKTKSIVGYVMFAGVLAGLVPARGADGNGNTPFEQGLYEEEANHQLEAAIANYRVAVGYLITNRQMLATAVFRLGECYRKEGKLNEARMQYRRILREFPEQETLVSLSLQVVGDATNPPPAYVCSFGNNGKPADNLRFPGGVTVDSAGNVYVSDTHNNRIQKFTAEGIFLMRWGGAGTNAGCFDYPQGLTTDRAGYVYVCDTHNHRIQKFTADGTFILEWGQQGRKAGCFNFPYAAAVDGKGNVFIADTHNHRIQKFTAEGAFISEFGENGTGPGQFDRPKSIAFDHAGNMFIADAINRRIQKFAADGKYLEDWGGPGRQPGRFDVPHDVAVDPWGNVYVADADGAAHNNRIQLFFNDGTLAAFWGSLGSGPGEFNFAARVAVDPTGLKIYVCDASNHRVQMFTYAGR